MLRSFLLCAALMIGLSCLPGCGGGGTEAEFAPSAAQTPEEIQEAADYEAEMKRVEQETYKNQ
jgi:hypothetical protein